jgi:vacuolar-type H+-ATPase subunit I/STV1
MSTDSRKLPSFGRIALVGFVVDAPFIGAFLLRSDTRTAASLFCGYCLAVLFFGLLLVLMGRWLEVLRSAAGDGARGRSASTMGFVAAMMGKYVIIIAALYLVWRTGLMSAIPVIGGFLLAQITIMIVIIGDARKSMAGSQVDGPNGGGKA